MVIIKQPLSKGYGWLAQKARVLVKDNFYYATGGCNLSVWTAEYGGSSLAVKSG